MIARRTLLGASIAAAGVGLYGTPVAAHGQDETPPDPRQALIRLRHGNQRWVDGTLLSRDPAADRRRRVAGAQHPFAVVFSCIDSRVPPEYLFDQDLGDLFVVRTGAQSLDPLVAGSIEYGPAHGVPLVFVLGHTSCGAIRATVESIEDGVQFPGHLMVLVNALRPAYEVAQRSFDDSWTRTQRIDATVDAQVELTVAQLRTFIKGGLTEVAGGRYNLRSGVVTRVV